MPFATLMIGWVNDVGSAQLNPMPTSQDTSTMRLPAVKATRSFSVTKTRGASGSCRTQLTTMSLSASSSATGTTPSGVSANIWSGASGSGAIWMIWVEWIGDPTAATSRFVNTRTSSTPWEFNAVTAPRAVAPNPSTAARMRRP